MSWRKKLDKRTSSGADITTDAKALIIVSSEDRPFGMGTNGSLNKELIRRLKRLPCPSDNWTWGLSWDSDEKMWSHFMTVDNEHFSSLEDFIGTRDFMELEADRALISSVSFRKDTKNGAVPADLERTGTPPERRVPAQPRRCRVGARAIARGGWAQHASPSNSTSTGGVPR